MIFRQLAEQSLTSAHEPSSSEEAFARTIHNVPSTAHSSKVPKISEAVFQQITPEQVLASKHGSQ
ncbi:MAG: hypothetical protein ACRDF4_11130, partial [Rhabdochlamydiaceae bacterium]